MRLLIILLVSTSVFGQWRTETSKSQFDGKYKAAYVQGKGEKFPYNNKPRLIINKFEDRDFGMYIANMGYTGCDRNSLEFTFGDDIIYTAKSPSTNADDDILFFREFREFSKYDFIQRLMKESRLYVRFASTCTKNDMEFTLSGSTKAIKYVIGEWLEGQREEMEALKAEYDEVAAYYKKLTCEDLLDTTTVMHTEYISRDGNLFKTKEGNMTALKGAIVKYYNSNNSKYNFKINYIRGAYETNFHVDADAARYFTPDKRVIDIMDKGMKDFRKLADACE